MIRTIWLAAFCLAAICGLCASKVTASISPPEEGVPDRTMVSFATDTLTQADRMDAVNLAAESKTIFSFALPPDPIVVLPGKSPTMSADAIVRRKPDLSASRGTVMLPRPRPKVRLTQSGKAH
jgi:hypothetical protein